MTREAMFYPLSLALIELWFCLGMYCFALTLQTSEKYMKRIMQFSGAALTSLCAVVWWISVWYFQYNYLM